MYSIGIDVGGMSVKIGLVKDGKILSKTSVKTKDDPYKTFEEVAVSITKLLETATLSILDIKGIGIGFPGIVNDLCGKVIFLPNLPWSDFLVKEELKKYFPKTHVKISNDANLAALGEVKYGVAKNYKSAVMFTLGTGVGGGVVIDGKLFEGNGGTGAELGHITLISGGETCGCGRLGCLEAYASATALIRQTKEKMLLDKDSLMWKEVNGNIDNVNGTTAFECVKKGDKSAIEVYDTYATYLGDGILNMLNAFRPEVFILGGGISNHGSILVDRLKAHCERYNYGIKGALETEILIAKLSNDAGILGASALFCD